MKSNLSKKRILFIAPIFHDYHQLIIDKLTDLGADVTFFPERDYGLIFKTINNIFPKYLEKYQADHYKKIIKETDSSSFDYLFVIRGYMMTEDFIRQFRILNPDAKLIMYQWDSAKTHSFSNILGHFDLKYSFDFEDCKAFPNLEYLPLFYSDDVTQFAGDKNKADYDFFFMGYFFPERYNAVVKFKQFALDNNYKVKTFLYMPLSSYIKELLKGTKIDRTIVSLKPMKRNDYLTYLSKTRVMVDVSNPNQTGLAMRIIESIATNTKVLTNNYRLKEDLQIYNEQSIAFFDDKNPIFDKGFLKVKEMHSQKDVLSIKNWLQLIFKIT